MRQHISRAIYADQNRGSADNFLDLCPLACALSEVEEFCSSDLTAAYDLNVSYVRGMKRPCLLNTNAVGHLTNCECLADACALTLDNNAFEDLNSLTVAFFDLAMYAYCITYTELRKYALLLSIFDLFDNVAHIFSLLFTVDVLNTRMNVLLHLRKHS